MKNLLILTLLITVLFGCKKDEEQEKLMRMSFNLSNDWHLYAHSTIEPIKFRRSNPFDPCDKLATWSFGKNGFISITQDLSCNPNLYVLEGTWKMENTKTLKLNFTQTKIGLVDPVVSKQTSEISYIVEEISTDTLKLKQDVLIYDADINSTISGVERFIFIR